MPRNKKKKPTPTRFERARKLIKGLWVFLWKLVRKNRKKIMKIVLQIGIIMGFVLIAWYIAGVDRLPDPLTMVWPIQVKISTILGALLGAWAASKVK